MVGDTFNQNHNGSGNNVVNIGQQPFALTQNLLDDILSRVDKSKPISLQTANGGDQEKIAMGQRIAEFLVAHGFLVYHHIHTNLTNYPPQPKPLHVENNIVTFDPT